jgi:hypothetical protein
MLSLAAMAQTGDAACSKNSAAGTYGFSDSGTVFTVGPRTAMGIFTLDGLGNLLNGKATQSLNGSISPETFRGTYTIDPDCTGTFAIEIIDPTSVNLDVKGNLAWDDNMNQIRIIFTSVAVASTGSALATDITGEGRKLVTQNEQ